jgi:hypothetical protein
VRRPRPSGNGFESGTTVGLKCSPTEQHALKVDPAAESKVALGPLSRDACVALALDERL